MARRVVGVTMGDPAGVGPEIILKALADGEWQRDSIPLVLGDEGVMDLYSTLLDLDVPLIPVGEGDVGTLEPLEEGAYILSLTCLNSLQFSPGRTTPYCGEAVVRYIGKAVDLALDGKIAAMVTAPISKASMHAAGYTYPGHTEFLAELTGCDDYAMMLVGGRIRVSLVTIHVALKDVPSLVTKGEVCRVARLTFRCMKDWFGLGSPRVAVAGLNPHAGEEGAFGDEEGRVIGPAVEVLRGEGYPVSGPHPADTLFHRHARGEFDAVVAMYHDQGLIPVKLEAFDRGVNLTLGLPIIRTSVDHGTALDIAGKGAASPNSLKAAYSLALELARRRKAGAFGP